MGEESNIVAQSNQSPVQPTSTSNNEVVKKPRSNKRLMIIVMVVIGVLIVTVYLLSITFGSVSPEETYALELMKTQAGILNVEGLEDCKSESNSNVKFICIISYAINLTDKSLCSELKSDHVELCLVQINEVLKDPEICLSLKEQEYRDFCLEDIADSVYDSSICDTILDQSGKNRCLDKVNRTYTYFQICPQFFDANYPNPSDLCDEFLMNDNTDASLCNLLQGSEKERCIRLANRFDIEGYEKSKISAKKYLEEFNQREKYTICGHGSYHCEFTFKNNILALKLTNFPIGRFSSPIKILKNSSIEIIKRRQKTDINDYSSRPETPICDNPRIISINGGEYFDIPIDVMEEYILEISCDFDLTNQENEILINNLILYNYDSDKLKGSATIFLN